MKITSGNTSLFFCAWILIFVSINSAHAIGDKFGITDRQTTVKGQTQYVKDLQNKIADITFSGRKLTDAEKKEFDILKNQHREANEVLEYSQEQLQNAKDKAAKEMQPSDIKDIESEIAQKASEQANLAGEIAKLQGRNLTKAEKAKLDKLTKALEKTTRELDSLGEGRKTLQDIAEEQKLKKEQTAKESQDISYNPEPELVSTGGTGMLASPFDPVVAVAVTDPFVGGTDSASSFASMESSTASSLCFPSCGEISSFQTRSGLLIGVLGLGGLTYILVNGDDDNDTSNGSGDSSGSNPPQDSSPPQESSPPSNGGSTSFSGTANLSCSKVSDPRNSFQFAVASIQGGWGLTRNGVVKVNINNAGANLSGSGSNGSFSVSGSGNVAGFNTNISVNGAYQMPPNGQLTATVTTGPLSASDDIVKMLCQGPLNF